MAKQPNSRIGTRYILSKPVADLTSGTDGSQPSCYWSKDEGTNERGEGNELQVGNTRDTGGTTDQDNTAGAALLIFRS
jgi:hypothetical protein